VFHVFVFTYLEIQGEDVDTEAEFTALEKQFADKKAVCFFILQIEF